MAKRTHVLRTHKLTLHNRAWQQMNQIFKTITVQCVHHSLELYCLQSVAPLINGLVDDLLVKTLPAGAHSVLGIVQVGNWNAICDTRSATELPRQHSRPDLSPGCC